MKLRTLHLLGCSLIRYYSWLSIALSLVFNPLFKRMKRLIAIHIFLYPSHLSFPFLCLSDLTFGMTPPLCFTLDACSCSRQEPTNRYLHPSAVLMLIHLLLWNTAFSLLCSSPWLFLVSTGPFRSIFYLPVTHIHCLLVDLHDRQRIDEPISTLPNVKIEVSMYILAFDPYNSDGYLRMVSLFLKKELTFKASTLILKCSPKCRTQVINSFPPLMTSLSGRIANHYRSSPG